MPTNSTSYTLTFNGTYPASNTSNTIIYNFNPSQTSFYWDGLLATPTVGTVTINDISSGTTRVCGLYVYSGNLIISVTTNTIKNVGYYYFNSTNLLTYTSSINGTIPSETTTTNVTAGIASGLINNTTGLTLTNTGLTITDPTQSYASVLTISSTAYNIAGTNAVSTSSSYSLIYDPLSVGSLITSIPSITTAPLIGCRVWSGSTSTLGNEQVASTTLNTISNTGASFSSSLYDNTQSIITGDYIYELLFANNTYTNYSSYVTNYSSYKSNTLNYSTLNSSGLPITIYTGTQTSYRYTTFAWKVDTTNLTSAGYKNINFVLNNVSSTSALTKDASGSLLIGTYRLPLFYRVEDTANINDFSKATSTPWINGNLYSNSTQISSANFTSTTTNYTGLSSNTGITIDGSTITFNVILGNPLTKSSPTTTYIYTRIAIPTAVEFSFKNITCNLI